MKINKPIIDLDFLQVDLSAKLQEDPLVAIRKREEEARRQFLQNPIQLKKLQDALKQQELKKQIKKHKKSKKSESDSDLDKKITSKLKSLKGNSLAIQLAKNEKKKKQKDNSLDIILMHKYNELKDKLSQKDIEDILAGRTSSSNDSDSDNGHSKAKVYSGDEKPNKKPISKQAFRSRDRNLVKRQYSTDSSQERKGKRRTTGSENSKINYKSKNMKEENIAGDIRKHENKSKKVYETNKGSKRNYRKEKMEEKNRKESSSEPETSEDEESYTVRKKSNKKENFKRKNRTYKSDSSIAEKYKSKRRYRSSSSDDRKDERKSANKKKHGDYSKSTKAMSRRDSSSDHSKSKNKSNYKEKKLSKDVSRDIKTNEKTRKETSSSSDSSSITSSSDSDEENKKNKEMDKCDNSMKNPNTETELDKIILQKLRMLRNETESKAKQIEKNEDKLYSHYDSDNDEHVYKKKSFGLVRADGTKMELKGNSQPSTKTVENKKSEPIKDLGRRKTKRLTEQEKEELRNQMMRDAEDREKERSDNLRKYREEDEKEDKERKSKEFDKNFVHKELLKSTKDSSVESRIKSKLNNIQRSSRDMTSNFSKRH